MDVRQKRCDNRKQCKNERINSVEKEKKQTSKYTEVKKNGKIINGKKYEIATRDAYYFKYYIVLILTRVYSYSL